MGWYLALVDAICKEYGAVHPDDIKLRLPLGEAFGLYAAIDARRSGGSSANYEAMELIEAIEAMEAAT